MTRLLPLVVLAGCLQIPDSATPQCYSDSDCDETTGEVCQEGVCYGDPPSGKFGVSIEAPAERVDLTSVERASEDLPDYGFLADLTLETPVTLTVTVTAASCAPPTLAMDCPTGAVGAAVTIRRPPRFAGGDGFQLTARSLTAAGDVSIMLPVPRTRPNDPVYAVTVVPDDLGAAGGSGVAPAELVPPLRTTLNASEDLPIALALGGDKLPVITGDLVDSDGAPLVGYRVSATGRWAGDTADSEVSSVAYTTDGHYQIVLSDQLVGPVTIVAKPLAPGATATLQLPGVDSAKSSTQDLAAPAGLGTAAFAMLAIEGTSTGGSVDPVAGARVIATATIAAGSGSGSAATAAAVITADVTTGDDGIAQLPLLDGAAFAAGYHLLVVPPAGSTLAVLDEPAFLAASGTRVLVPRVALQGAVVDASGAPVSNVSVTVRPSLQLVWTVDPATQLFLAQIPAATAVTPGTGAFVVFVDPTIAGVPASYDITFEPPSGSSVPSFTIANYDIPMGATAATPIAFGTQKLPEAAALHGRISDPGGNPVAGGELRVFRLPADQSLCAAQLPHKPSPCAVPAQLQAHATSDADGVVRFTLPRQ